MMKSHLYRNWLVVAGVLAILLAGISYPGQAAPPLQGPSGAAQSRNGGDSYEIKLKSRQFRPGRGVEVSVQNSEGERGHVILQFEDIPTEETKADLAAIGVNLLGYIPDKAWLASIPADLDLSAPAMANLRWMGGITPLDKLTQALANGRPGSWAIETDGRVKLNVRYFQDISQSQAEQIVRRKGAEILSVAPEFYRLTIKLPQNEIAALAGEDGIQWLEEVPPPPTISNNGVRSRTNVNLVQAAPYNLSGAGVSVGIWDGGPVDNHIDFSGRLTIVDTNVNVNNHATHVAGTVAGSGALSGGTYRGMAPAANIFSYDYQGNTISEHNSAINSYDVELSQNSWALCVGPIPMGGCPPLNNCDWYGSYYAIVSEYDDIVVGRYGKKVPVVFSAGNERDDGDCGMSSALPYLNYGNITPPGGPAKNVIVVGAVNSDDDSMTTFSSWGPVDDGRIKPDVVAPGCNFTGGIQSTWPGNIYAGICGTSMAAPAVSGIVALMIEQYRNTFSTNDEPLPSTIKALLIHGAKDLDDSSSYYNAGPDYASGYGRVDAKASVDLIRNRDFFEGSVGHKEKDVFSLNVPPGATSLKVTLVWDDPPGEPNANSTLVNDLDILLAPPGDSPQYLTWVLNPANPSNPATQSFDGINNVEQAQIDNPASGTWTVYVDGFNVPQGSQAYSLVTEYFDENLASNCQAQVSSIPDTNYYNIQIAVDAASSGDTVKVAGTCRGVEFRKETLQVAYIDKNITLHGGYTTTNWLTPDPVAYPTTLDAKGEGRVIYISGNVNLTIEGLRITGGDATGLGGYTVDSMFGPVTNDTGGGVYAITATATLNNNHIFGNATDDYGGGIFLYNSATTLTNNQVYSNTAGVGGGLYAVTSNGATLQGNMITANQATGSGGGIYLDKSVVDLNDNALTLNTASSGGGLYLWLSDATINGNTIASNSVTGDGFFSFGDGGGVYIYGSAPVLSDNTIQDNIANGNFSSGGGLYLSASNAAFNNNTVSGNQAASGGGLWLYNSNATLKGNVIESNIASGQTSNGGGLYLSSSSITLDNDAISMNEAQSGGGVYLSLSRATFDDSVVTANTAASLGGGLMVASGSASATITIVNSAFSENEASHGGGLANFGLTTTVTIFNSSFIDNEATSGYGGASLDAVAGPHTYNIEGSAFISNSAGLGGGAIDFSSPGGALSITNTTISGNRAGKSGGGIESDNNSKSINLNNVTIANNIADNDGDGEGEGGGINRAAGAYNIANSIIAKNSDNSPVNKAPDCAGASGTIVSAGYNLIGDTSGCNWSDAGGDVTGATAAPIEPLLEALTGSPAYHPLQVDSPVIDAGNPAQVGGIFPACAASDQRAQARPVDGDLDNIARCDIGAYEFAEIMESNESSLYLPLIIK